MSNATEQDTNRLGNSFIFLPHVINDIHIKSERGARLRDRCALTNPTYSTGFVVMRFGISQNTMCKFYAVGLLAFMAVAVASCGSIYQPPKIIQGSKTSVLVQLKHRVSSREEKFLSKPLDERPSVSLPSIRRPNTATEQEVHEMARRECAKHGKTEKFRIRSCDQAVSTGLAGVTHCLVSNYLFDCERVE